MLPSSARRVLWSAGGQPQWLPFPTRRKRIPVDTGGLGVPGGASCPPRRVGMGVVVWLWALRRAVRPAVCSEA